MILGTFYRNEAGQVTSFEITGHAGFGVEGEDIVCAAASSLAITTLNSIDALAGFQPIVKVDEIEGGYLSAVMSTAINQEQINIAQILLESLAIGFQSIQEEYSEYLQIKTINQ
ncbi:uncharacterized protein YsxB (DUF464 family) [Enterococcus sp. PF1-24]|uniref:ribosomal-processing cysteine protease Prp n=1 Tax=unclassified Enterococcus TaxID=2608891 RepID=UPI0024747D04|nr:MULTISPECIES: ribosomal-processing cysteine protease Prp [unclassified Enterococcus]MDH6363708.1 uncharacterized protein YsxB (DUF464 family) [Enterococcus sp. PFB1-1]MDH6400664.1 uncharacterized protein YsxB (DUF464 family) [Enterococcus sp. PF1-24]